MGLITGSIKGLVDLCTLPVAAAADIVTVGQLDLTKKVAKKLKEDAEEVGRAMEGQGDFL